MSKSQPEPIKLYAEPPRAEPSSEPPRVDRARFDDLAAAFCADMERDGFWDEPVELHKQRLRELYDAVFELEGNMRLEAIHVWDTVAKKLIIAEELHRLGLDCDPEQTDSPL